ncbi:hypothetical protein DL93DRAFT_712859 [Clavulina sp. PMI_390]|nr:hypothetical protein DL93DRAFT_712859 [Clavulina sp. PMI_390]
MSSSSNLVIPSNVNPGAPRQAKRKRLLKACAPCNKSKRRCDGTAPCQNCTFAGKNCIYTDSSGREVPPPNPQPQPPPILDAPHALSHPASLSHQHPSAHLGPVDPRFRSDRMLPPLPYSYQHGSPQQYLPFGAGVPPPRAMAGTVSDPIPTNAFVAKLNMGIEPIVVQELVNIFFSHVHPYNAMFHRPTFLSHLGLGRVPLYLLNSMLALAAPHYPPFQSDNSTPRWHAGDRFAQQSIRELFDDQGNLNYNAARRAGDELEVTQALVCLDLHEATRRRPSHPNNSYLALATEILVSLGVPDWDVVSEEPPPTYALSPSLDTSSDYRTTWRRRECLRRTLWVVHYANMLATAFSNSPVKYKELDVRLYLPVDEGIFDMMIPDDTIPEYLTIPKDGRPSRMYISEVGHLLRMTSIYSQMVGFVAESQRLDQLDTAQQNRWRGSVEANIRSHESALANWEASLPPRLRLNEENVKMHISSLELGISNGAWAYMYMHSLAKCALIALYNMNISDVSSDAATLAQRRKEESARVYDELIWVLKSYGARGRSNIYMATLLFVRILLLFSDSRVFASGIC